ncbi:hypothetical protein MNBD_ALPHA03-1123 [hydrothermal vent metagenome]|uniref:HPr kinase/phosphorylase C-terminal domain-containing protein n=1 Tax=hydrothermal vent metagenome TaxID=652676 RepID=A0A3B1AZA3_9ZZZZ
MILVHGTGIFIDGKGVLIKGASGSGKSDLALRLMGFGAELIGDDYVEVSRMGQDQVVMQAPETIAGKIEVRNVGLLNVPFRHMARIDLVVELVLDVASLERLPPQKVTLLDGAEIPCLDFYAFEASAPEKLRSALKILSQAF